jgi:2-methylcitrate dehydratase
MAQTLADRFARYTFKLRYEDLPPAVVHEVKRRVIDSFATAVGAMDAEAYSVAKRCALRVQSDRLATLFGGGTSSVEWATFVNGLLIRYLDYNDTYLSLEPAHPSDNLAPVLAVGESVGVSGKQIITAAVLGYEIQCRLCDAASLRMQGIDHVTYGAISSALAAGKLMELNATQLRHAVGIAGVCNVALRQTRSGELSMWKGCAFANAARNGVFAALLAAEGLTGPAPIFEGDLGFMNLVTRQPFIVAPMGGEEGASDFMMPQTYIKFWPAEYHSQSSIDAALQLRPAVGDIKHVKSITIHTFEAAYNIIGKYPEQWRPQTRETADHSMAYCTAIALLDGEVTDRQFEHDRFTDPAVLEVVAKVKILLDDALTTRYPRGIPNRVVVAMDDGRSFEKEVEFPRGHSGNPMTDAEVEAKFRTLVEPRYGRERVEKILSACWQLEKLESAGTLTKLLDIQQ